MSAKLIPALLQLRQRIFCLSKHNVTHMLMLILRVIDISVNEGMTPQSAREMTISTSIRLPSRTVLIWNGTKPSTNQKTSIPLLDVKSKTTLANLSISSPILAKPWSHFLVLENQGNTRIYLIQIFQELLCPASGHSYIQIGASIQPLTSDSTPAASKNWCKKLIEKLNQKCCIAVN